MGRPERLKRRLARPARGHRSHNGLQRWPIHPIPTMTAVTSTLTAPTATARVVPPDTVDDTVAPVTARDVAPPWAAARDVVVRVHSSPDDPPGISTLWRVRCQSVENEPRLECDCEVLKERLCLRRCAGAFATTKSGRPLKQNSQVGFEPRKADRDEGEPERTFPHRVDPKDTRKRRLGVQHPLTEQGRG